MANVLGLRGGGSQAANERPTNFREGILYLYPNSPAILTALTGKLKSEATNDPQFSFFWKGLPQQTVTLNATEPDAETDIALVSTSGLKAGHLLFNGTDVGGTYGEHEVIRVVSVDSGTNITVVREVGNTADTYALTSGVVLTIIGSAYPEGADTPEAITSDATTVTNYTQIFRTSMKLTGTFAETYLRTGAIDVELKREIAERHAVEMEYAFLFGNKSEVAGTGIGASQALRTTGGLLQFIDTNVYNAAGTVSISDWEDFLEDVFLVPASKNEKIMLCGNKCLTALNAMARSYGQIDLVPTSEAFGMKLSRWETPYGTLYLKGHPLLSQNSQFNDWGFIVDLSNIKYRFMKNRDTKFLKDRQAPGIDGVTHEYLTECGLEIRHEQTHGILKNCTAFAP